MLKVASGQIKELEDNREFAEEKDDQSIETNELPRTKANKNNGEEVRKMSVDSGVVDNSHSASEEDGHSTGGDEETITTTTTTISYKLRQRKLNKA